MLAFVLMSNLVLAQTARNPGFQHEGQTVFSKIAATGLDVQGNPGFLMLRGVGNAAWGGAEADTNTHWYLWVDEDNDLCMASHVTISAFSSFPDGNWDNDNFIACTKVGPQS